MIRRKPENNVPAELIIEAKKVIMIIKICYKNLLTL